MPQERNDDFGARYYSSRLSRWLSPDWSAVPEPVPYANLTNPQTLNLYAMVSDNPETFADLDGHEIIYAANLKNPQLVKDIVQAILADPNTRSNLSGYVGKDNPDLTIQSGDLSGLDEKDANGNLKTITQGDTYPNIQTTTMSSTQNGVTTTGAAETTLINTTITIDNRTGKGDVPGVLVHESVHAGEARANPSQYQKDEKAERSLPHDQRPQEERANDAERKFTQEIKKSVKQIEKERKKNHQ